MNSKYLIEKAEILSLERIGLRGPDRQAQYQDQTRTHWQQRRCKDYYYITTQYVLCLLLILYLSFFLLFRPQIHNPFASNTVGSSPSLQIWCLLLTPYPSLSHQSHCKIDYEVTIISYSISFFYTAALHLLKYFPFQMILTAQWLLLLQYSYLC